MKKLTTAEFIERAKKLHGSLFDYSEVIYKGMQEKVKITCNDCKTVIFPTPTHHLHTGKKKGCKHCFQTGDKNKMWNKNREQVETRSKIHIKMKSIIRHTVKTKNESSEKILGYSRSDLLAHFEQQKNWRKIKKTNYHIDHIFPVAAFVKHGISNPKVINNLKNLRATTAEENLKKSNFYNKNDFYNYLNLFTEEDLEKPLEKIEKEYQKIKAKTRIRTPSKFKMVRHSEKRGKPWSASIIIDKKPKHLGYFKTEKEAATHVDYFCLKYRGYAVNFLDKDYSNFKPIVQGIHFRSPKGVDKTKGVSFSKHNNYYVSRISHKNKRIHLGNFKTLKEAAENYDYYAIKIHGKNCYLNFPNKNYKNYKTKKVINLD